MTSFITMSGIAEGANFIPIAVFILIVVISTLYIGTWIIKRNKTSRKSKPNIKGPQPQQVKKKANNIHVTKKKGAQAKVPPVPEAKHNFEHPHLLSSLKGHKGQITGGEFSSNGKYFLTSADDRILHIWNTKDFANRSRRSVRVNVQFDHAQSISWSPDSKAFLIFKAAENAIEVYKINKKQDGSIEGVKKSTTFPKLSYDVIVISFEIAINGKFMMTCDSKNQMIIWDLKGNVVETYDTRHGDTYSAVISPCGRFIVTTGFTPDAKVWEVKFSKAGAFESIKRAFALTGHTSGIYNCAINCDSTKMATISKDGTWRLYHTGVQYNDDEEPTFLMSSPYQKFESTPFISISQDGRTIALASGPHLSTYSAITGQLIYSIKNIYRDFIKKLKFDPKNEYLLTIGDNHVNIFHNVAGYVTIMQDLQRSKATAKTKGMRERINVQIAEAKSILQKLDESVLP